MITEELLKYIESERKAGKDEARIREVLKSEGWSEKDLNEGFDKLKNYKNSHLVSTGIIVLILNLILASLAFFGFKILSLFFNQSSAGEEYVGFFFLGGPILGMVLFPLLITLWPFIEAALEKKWPKICWNKWVGIPVFVIILGLGIWEAVSH